MLLSTFRTVRIIESPVTTFLYQQLILHNLTYFVSIFDLSCIIDLFCSEIALFCITWPTYFVSAVDLICYKMVRRILTRFQGDTK